MKNYIGISRDHSASMRSLTKGAARDFNENLSSIRDAAIREVIPSYLTVIKCGVGRAAAVHMECKEVNVMNVNPMVEGSYIADGSATPLFDSVGQLIQSLESVPDAFDPEVSFLVMVITDGEENSSKRWTARDIASTIQRLQATDRWTFVFRVPRGYGAKLARLGIPNGNILEWDQTEVGIEQATVATQTAVTNYYSGRSKGIRSTTSFYPDLSHVSSGTVRTTLEDITSKLYSWTVNGYDPIEIADFFNARLGMSGYVKGHGYYELTKIEKSVSSHKEIIIRDRTNGRYYGGANARNLLGLPASGSVRLVPGNHGNFDIFIQSTSSNRKLVPGTKVLYRIA